MVRKVSFITLGTVVYLLIYFITLAAILFISDILKISPSPLIVLAFVIPYFAVYYFLSKFLPKEEAKRFSLLSVGIGILAIIGSCAAFVMTFSNAPNYW